MSIFWIYTLSIGIFIRNQARKFHNNHHSINTSSNKTGKVQKKKSNDSKPAELTNADAVKVVVQRCVNASLELGNNEIGRIQRGIIIFVSFSKNATDAAVREAAKGLVTLPLSTLGEWGDGNKTMSLLDIFKDTKNPQGVMVIPQACLTSSSKGKYFKYHHQLDATTGKILYCKFLAELETQATRLLIGEMFKFQIPKLSIESLELNFKSFDKRGVPTTFQDGSALSKSLRKQTENHFKEMEALNSGEWYEIRYSYWFGGRINHELYIALFSPIQLVAGTFGNRQGLIMDASLGPSTHILSWLVKGHKKRLLVNQRMAGKGKRILIRLVSSAGTGFFYTTKKNPTNTVEKLCLHKYDPIVRRHVLFNEAKMPSGKKR